MARRTERNSNLGPTEVYVDTSAFIAFLDRSDSYHSLFLRLFGEPPRLVTSSLVVAEGHGWFLRRYDSRRAVQFLNFLADLKPLEVAPFDSAALAECAKLAKRFVDQSITLADAHGLVLMRDRKVRLCWSSDRHLALTGATLVIAG